MSYVGVAPWAGFEPASPCGRRVNGPVRLPVPPPRIAVAEGGGVEPLQLSLYPGVRGRLPTVRRHPPYALFSFMSGTGGRIRTCGLRLRRAALCPLSYADVWYRGWDSNPHCSVSETVASAGWATPVCLMDAWRRMRESNPRSSAGQAAALAIEPMRRWWRR